MLFLLLIPALILAALVFGYRKLSAAAGTQAASGVLLMMLGVGAGVWVLSNLTW